MFQVLHPSFKLDYFKRANWEKDWIDEAIRLIREEWETYYKPAAAPVASAQPSASTSGGTGRRSAAASQSAATLTTVSPWRRLGWLIRVS